jgi:hypothetical protein
MAVGARQRQRRKQEDYEKSVGNSSTLRHNSNSNISVPMQGCFKDKGYPVK